MEDYENSKPDIPGLVNKEKGRKGKKKANNTTSKNSLTLQTFLHEDNKEAAERSSTSGRSNGALNHDPIESHFAKLNLDDEELIVMESCHSFIHDMLKHMGPTNAMDPRLQEEINNFPPEAKRVIQKCGGYRNFILRSKDLTVVDKVIAARVDLKRAQEMAFKEISVNGQNSHYPNQSKTETSKEIWNNKANVVNHSNKDFGNLWTNPPPAHNNVESFMNEQHGNSLYYKTTSKDNLKQGPGVIGNGASSSRKSPNGNEVMVLSKQLSEANDKNRLLVEANNALKKQLYEKEKMSEEYSSLQSRFSALEAVYNNTKNELDISKTELHQHRKELASLNSFGNAENNDKQIIFTLQNSLEAEKLKSLNLAKELENYQKLAQGFGANLVSQQETLSNSLFSNVYDGASSGGWEHSFAPMSVPVDKDMLGLRSIFSNDQSPVPGPIGPNNTKMDSNQKFAGLIGQSDNISSQQSSTSLGLSSMAILHDSPVHGIPPPSSVEQSSAFTSMFSAPPPATPTPPLPTSNRATPPGSGGSPVPGASQGAKPGRQEQLVKKLSGMLAGAEEETIKHCISKLRTKHGKLSGWPTSKIATHILEMINDNNGDILQ